MRWAKGEADIERLIRMGHLQTVRPDRSAADDLVVQARQHIASAKAILASDAEGAFQLAYDGARKALSAILENQGLRATVTGGHIALAEAVTAQLGSAISTEMSNFAWMRRTRNQTEYRTDRGPAANTDDATEAIAFAEAMLDIPGRVLEIMGVWV